MSECKHENWEQECTQCGVHFCEICCANNVKPLKGTVNGVPESLICPNCGTDSYKE